jgi:mRNA deadenylase 3'-5' endonuclease subunit Ccr4
LESLFDSIKDIPSLQGYVDAEGCVNIQNLTCLDCYQGPPSAELVKTAVLMTGSTRIEVCHPCTPQESLRKIPRKRRIRLKLEQIFLNLDEYPLVAQAIPKGPKGYVSISYLFKLFTDLKEDSHKNVRVVAKAITADSGSALQVSRDGTKVRARSLLERIRAQVEFYFSAEQLAHDAYLNNLVLQSSAESNGYVDLSIVLDFPRVQALFEQFDHDRARRLAVLRDALSKSCLLELDPSGEYVRLAPLGVSVCRTAEYILSDEHLSEDKHLRDLVLVGNGSVSLIVLLSHPMLRGLIGGDVDQLRAALRSSTALVLGADDTATRVEPYVATDIIDEEVPREEQQQQQQQVQKFTLQGNMNQQQHFANGNDQAWGMPGMPQRVDHDGDGGDGKQVRTSKAAIRRLNHLLDFYFHEFNVCHNRYLLHLLEGPDGTNTFTVEQISQFPRIHRILAMLDTKSKTQLLKSAVETLDQLSVDDDGNLTLDPDHTPQVMKFVGITDFDTEALVRSPVVLHDTSMSAGWSRDMSMMSGSMGMSTVTHSNEHLPADVFTVMGYNVLADIHARPELFPHCGADDLKWANRRAKLKREIIYHHSDVCCLHDVQSDCDPADDANSRQGTAASRFSPPIPALQPPPSEANEENHFGYFCEALGEAGYKGSVYKRRRPAPGSKSTDLEIGAAIFWDTNRMEFMRRWAWALSEDAPALSEYREVAVAVLLKHKATQKPVLVVASRFSSTTNEQVLAVQAHALLRRIARIRDALVVPVPIVLSLDCNADATSLAYRALLQGQLDFEEAPPAPPSKDESGKKQDAYEKFNRRADKLFEELEQCQLIPRPARTDRRSYSKDGDFHQNLPLKSAYAEVLGKEEPFSVYTEKDKRLRDYVFTTGVEPVAVLSGIHEHIVGKHKGMPSPRFPSSHLPLIAALRMAPK